MFLNISVVGTLREINCRDSSLSFLILITISVLFYVSSYKKTHETLSHAGQKTTAAISNVGTAISKKFGDMRYQHLLLLWSCLEDKMYKSFVSSSFPSILVF